MEFFDKYLSHFDKTPEECYREDVQAFIIQQWENNILHDNIILEDEPRSFIYDKNKIIEVLIDSVSEVSTNYAKIEGNYISVEFRNCDFQYNRGSMFYRPSEKSYYIVYQGTNNMRTTSKCKAIKCNNIVKWIDQESSEIYSYPCSLGYELTSTTSQDLKFVSVANSRLAVMLSCNENTSKLKLNQRLLFNGVPYRINSIKNYEENNYVDKEVEMLFLYLEKTSIEPTDDLVNNIANGLEKMYSIVSDQNEIKQIKDFEGKITVQLLCNDKVIDTELKWEANKENIVEIDNQGNYKLIGDIGDKCKIKCSYTSNLYIEIPVEIVENTEFVEELVITPNEDVVAISKGSYVDFYGALYVDNLKIEDADFELNGANGKYTYLILEDGGIRITCITPTTEPLVLTFKSGDFEKNINIKLKGIW